MSKRLGGLSDLLKVTQQVSSGVGTKIKHGDPHTPCFSLSHADID